MGIRKTVNSSSVDGSQRFSVRALTTRLPVVLGTVAIVCFGLCVRVVAIDPAVEGLKARLSSATVGEKPKLCVQIAERQMAETSRLYAAADDENAQPALTDVISYAELARDYAIQSHKYQKQTEIAVREMTRKLTEIMHRLSREERAPVQDAVTRLQHVQDDLLAAMFKKGAK